MARPPKPLPANLPAPLLTPSEAARLLRVSTRQLRSITQHGNIPYVDVGLGERETRRYRVADLEAFIAERTRRPSLRPVLAPSEMGLNPGAEAILVQLRARLAEPPKSKRRGRVKPPPG